jgi:hypothetical protein
MARQPTKSSVPPKTTTEQRQSGSQKATIAIEAIKRIVDILKPWELSRTQRHRTYQSMLRDDAVFSSWDTRTKMVQESQQNGRLKYDPNNEEAVAVAKYLKYCMSQMAAQTPRSVAGAASEMIYNLYAPFELVTRAGEGQYEGYHVLDKLVYINPLTIDPVKPFKTINGGNDIVEWYQLKSAFEESSGLMAKTQLNGEGKVAIDARKVMVASYSNMPNNPINGTSAFDAAYNAWREKGLINDFLIMGVQKDMAGIPILEVPQDLLNAAEEKNSDAYYTIESLKNQMANLHAGDQSFMIMPSDCHNENGTGAKLYNITFKGIDGSGKVFDLEALIDQRNRAIHKALGALNINSAEQGTASYNSLEGQTNIQYHYVKSDCRVIDEMWNKQIFPLLLRLNNWVVNSESMPVWEHGEVQEVSLEEFSKYFQRGKLFLPLVPQVVNRYLEVAKINYRVAEDMTTEQLKEIMAAAEDRSGESDGTSGYGSKVQSQDNNMENK